MKNYYDILGVPEHAGQEDIRKAFRKLAFQHHPDRNRGREKEAEQRFKEIKEAYGVLGDNRKRQEYDFARKSPLAGAGYNTGGFQYSQQDIFRDTFSNQATFDDLSRMFAQAGLRFDQDFLNRVFFSSGGTNFRVYYTHFGSQPYTQAQTKTTYKPGFFDRMLSKVAAKVGAYALKKLFGIRSPPKDSLDQHHEFQLSRSEAVSGGEKEITYQRGNQTKRLMVKIPKGVKEGTRIRLKGMGHVQGNKSGDLYLHVRLKP